MSARDELDYDDQVKLLQDDINAAYERLKSASTSYSLQQGVFLIGEPGATNAT